MFTKRGAARIHRLDTIALPVSSSETRQQLSREESPAELPQGVLEYIRERGFIVREPWKHPNQGLLHQHGIYPPPELNSADCSTRAGSKPSRFGDRVQRRSVVRSSRRTVAV